MTFPALRVNIQYRFLAGISQAHHQPVHGGGFVSKQHMLLLKWNGQRRKGGEVTSPALRVKIQYRVRRNQRNSLEMETSW